MHTERAPQSYKSGLQGLGEAWFRPKNFENPKIYEALGVRIYKKWIPTGDMVARTFFKDQAPFYALKSKSTESLQRWEEKTRFFETIHTSSFVGMSTLATIELFLVNGYLAAATAGINTLINAYPILVQRYNRGRIYKVLNRRIDNKLNLPGKGDTKNSLGSPPF